MPTWTFPLTRTGGWLAAVAVMALALHLRPGATAIGPVLGEMTAELGMSASMAGALTALPGLAFAVFGILAVRLAIRTGLNHALMLGAVAVGVGLLARSFAPDTTTFLLLTALALAGMGVGNVLVPAFIKRNFPGRRNTARMTTVYTVLLALGATLPPALAGPMTLMPGGWRATIGVWGGTALLAALPWFLLARRERAARDAGAKTRPGSSLLSLFRSRKAVALALFFGAQSMQAYVQFGWIAQIYRDGGVDRATAGVLASIIAGFGIPMGLAMPTVIARVRSMTLPVVAMGVLMVGGYLGVWLAPTTLSWLWACLLGLSGAAFPTAIALITARTRDAGVTTRVSGFIQPVGYLIAAPGPLAVGILYDVTGGWAVPLGVLIATSVVMVTAGIIAAAPGYIDDELAAGT